MALAAKTDRQAIHSNPPEQAKLNGMRNTLFLIVSILGLLCRSGEPTPPAADPGAVLCFVSDLHFIGAKPQAPANARMRQALTKVATLSWPATIDGQPSGLPFAGTPVGQPAGTVLLGDLSSNGSRNDLNGLPWADGFRDLYESNPKEKHPVPVWIGLGNHDFGDEGKATRMLDYVKTRHGGKKPPVPPLEFDAASACYAFECGGALVVQLHRHAADTASGAKASGLPWLKALLAKRAGDSRPVILCQHYGFDPFGKEPRWWTDQERAEFLQALQGYNVVGLFHGHSHAAAHYQVDKLDVYRVNNVAPEIGEGNNDGPGSFTLVRIAPDGLTVLPCLVNADGTLAFSRNGFDYKPATPPSGQENPKNGKSLKEAGDGQTTIKTTPR